MGREANSREELGEGAAAHVFGHDANHGGIISAAHDRSIEAQHIGVVQIRQHVCLAPEGRAVGSHLPRLLQTRSRSISEAQTANGIDNFVQPLKGELHVTCPAVCMQK